MIAFFGLPFLSTGLWDAFWECAEAFFREIADAVHASIAHGDSAFFFFFLQGGKHWKCVYKRLWSARLRNIIEANRECQVISCGIATYAPLLFYFIFAGEFIRVSGALNLRNIRWVWLNPHVRDICRSIKFNLFLFVFHCVGETEMSV